mmetsp:Transcript_99446/g.287046  ORF Transcript_99446/g.287046 Transcript_99446/m.287046 type:complete len:291 (-) Transcript_99446:33-905(-)
MRSSNKLLTTLATFAPMDLADEPDAARRIEDALMDDIKLSIKPLWMASLFQRLTACASSSGLDMLCPGVSASSPSLKLKEPVMSLIIAPNVILYAVTQVAARITRNTRPTSPKSTKKKESTKLWSHKAQAPHSPSGPSTPMKPGKQRRHVARPAATNLQSAHAVMPQLVHALLSTNSSTPAVARLARTHSCSEAMQFTKHGNSGNGAAYGHAPCVISSQVVLRLESIVEYCPLPTTRSGSCGHPGEITFPAAPLTTIAKTRKRRRNCIILQDGGQRRVESMGQVSRKNPG